MLGRRRTGVLLVASALVLAACGGDDGANGDVGATLPDVEIVELSGGAVGSLSQIEGPAVVNLWATWCAPCRAEIPDFEEVHQERSDEVRFVGINIGEDAGPALAFIDEVGATYDQFRDPEGFVVTELRTTAMPVTLVLDANGEVTKRHLGPLSAADLNAAIDRAIAG
jgi:thiol-disulfide isomerase/thioredoxin